jgi:hypothetical protein
MGHRFDRGASALIWSAPHWAREVLLSLVEATTFGHGTQRVEIRKVQGSPV